MAVLKMRALLVGSIEVTGVSVLACCYCGPMETARLPADDQASCSGHSGERPLTDLCITKSHCPILVSLVDSYQMQRPGNH